MVKIKHICLTENKEITEKTMKNTKDIKPVEVKIHIPEKVDSALKQQKINRLYDILAPKKNKSA